MDYKYIEQLLERYWECETSLEEEAILRNFFAQENLPAHLLPYRNIFLAEDSVKEEKLSDDFDARILAQIEEEQKTTKIVPITTRQRLRPLYKSTAVVAILLTLGMAEQQGFKDQEDVSEQTQAHITDTVNNITEMPEVVDQASAVLPASSKDSVKSNTPLTDQPEEVAN